jgi:large subunit ribosomal protein L25
MKKGSLKAEARTGSGKGEAGRLRRDGRIPGIVYGAGAEPVRVALVEKDVTTALRTGVRLLDLKVGAESLNALLKDVQYDHLGERLVHVDFQRLVKGQAIEIRVPITYRGTPVGLKDHGVFNVVHDTLLVSCLPEDMPEGLSADVSGLAMGQALHVSEVALPKGVTAAGNPDEVLAVVTHSDREVETVAAAVPEEGTVTQPEVIGEAERKAREEAKAAAEPGAKKDKK